MKLHFKSLVADETTAKYEREKKERLELERQRRENEKQELIQRKADKKEADRREIERLEVEKRALLKQQRESKRSMSFVSDVKPAKKQPSQRLDPPPVSARAPAHAKHAPVAIKPIQAASPPAAVPVVSVPNAKGSVKWKPAKGMVVEVNVGDDEDEDEEDGEQWLPGLVVSDMHTDGTIEVWRLLFFQLWVYSSFLLLHYVPCVL